MRAHSKSTQSSIGSPATGRNAPCRGWHKHASGRTVRSGDRARSRFRLRCLSDSVRRCARRFCRAAGSTRPIGPVLDDGVGIAGLGKLNPHHGTDDGNAVVAACNDDVVIQRSGNAPNLQPPAPHHTHGLAASSSRSRESPDSRAGPAIRSPAPRAPATCRRPLRLRSVHGLVKTASSMSITTPPSRKTAACKANGTLPSGHH